MWRDTRITSMLNIKHPIILAPMASATNAEIVANVSNPGGLGSFGAAGTKPDALRETIHAIRAKTDKAFNINLFSAHTEVFDTQVRPGPKLAAILDAYHVEQQIGEVPEPGPMFGPAEEQLDVLLAERVPVISFHFGVDRTTVTKAQTHGAKVLCSATTVEEARVLEQAGVDAIIAQGAEAGGHRGTFIGNFQHALIGTMALVPQICDAVSIPVIAAGGIMDARGVVASLALGASAAQMGTAFLGCQDAPISSVWREQLRHADPSNTTVTKALSGKPARGLRNRYIDEVESAVVSAGEELLPYPAQYSVSRVLRKKATEDNNPDFLAMWSGQGVAMLKPMPSQALVEQLVAQTQQLLNRISSA